MDYNKIFSTTKRNFLLLCEAARKRIFLLFCLLVLAAFFAAGLIFYRYAYKVAYGPVEKAETEISVNQKLFKEADSRLKEAEAWSQEAETREFKNPFK